MSSCEKKDDKKRSQNAKKYPALCVDLRWLMTFSGAPISTTLRTIKWHLGSEMAHCKVHLAMSAAYRSDDRMQVSAILCYSWI